MIVIGLTGGIGTGKSTVSRVMTQLGARMVEADKVGHELYRPGAEAWGEVVKAFGRGILQADNSIDRKKLAEIVFNNPEELKRLNQIMYPRILDRVLEVIEGWREEGVKVAVLEAALLYEAGWEVFVDEVWVTIAPEEVIIERLCRDKAFTPEQVRARLRSQMDMEEKAKLGRVVLDNDGDLEKLRKQVEGEWQRLNST